MFNKWFNKFSNKKRRIIGFSTMSVMIGFFSLSALMTVPGMGIESLIFIKSVEKEIKRITPKGKYVLDPTTGPLYDIAITNTIKPSFVAEAVSTLNFYDEHDYLMIEYYTIFANNWFNKYWQPKVDAREEIDLYDIGINFVEFDKTIASLFGGYGFINPGLTYMFYDGHKNKLWSKEAKQFALKQQTIMVQEIYEANLEFSNNPLTGLKVTDSIGSSIVNNKVWFLNQNIDSITTTLALPVTPFKLIDGKKPSGINTKTTVDDLYHPNFIAALNVLRAGVIFLVLNLITIPLGIIATRQSLKGTVKEKKVKENSN